MGLASGLRSFAVTAKQAMPKGAAHAPRCHRATRSPGRKRRGTRLITKPTTPLRKTAARKFSASASAKLPASAFAALDTGTQASHAATLMTRLQSDVIATSRPSSRLLSRLLNATPPISP